MSEPLFTVDIDLSQFEPMMNQMQSVMKEEQFMNAMAGIFRKTGNRVKTIMRTEPPKEYRVNKTDGSKSVGKAKVTVGESTAGCTVPIQSERHKLGKKRSARTFASTGGAAGWETLPVQYGGKGKKYRIKVNVLKGGKGTLPQRMSSYGGQPPFRNTAAPSLNNLVYTRLTTNRLPIVLVKAIGVPQMPTNRSEDDVQRELKEYFEKQMKDRFEAMLRIGK